MAYVPVVFLASTPPILSDPLKDTPIYSYKYNNNLLK